MTAWLNEYLTAQLYLTAAAMATGLLIVLLFFRTRTSMAMRVCASLAIAMWAGLALRNEWETGEPRTLLLACGVFAICFLVLTLWPGYWRSRCQAKLIRDARSCKGRLGKVYRAIEPGKQDRVEIMRDRQQLRLPAVCESDGPLDAFVEVEVRDVTEDGVLVVAAVK